MHRITEIDPVARTGMCEECGITKIAPNGSGWRCGTKKSRDSVAYDIATSRHEGRYRKGKKPHHVGRGTRCSRCGLAVTDPRLIDVHHKDGNHLNNDPGNLCDLCPTCHRGVHLGLW